MLRVETIWEIQQFIVWAVFRSKGSAGIFRQRARRFGVGCTFGGDVVRVCAQDAAASEDAGGRSRCKSNCERNQAMSLRSAGGGEIRPGITPVFVHSRC